MRKATQRTMKNVVVGCFVILIKLFCCKEKNCPSFSFFATDGGLGSDGLGLWFCLGLRPSSLKFFPDRQLCSDVATFRPLWFMWQPNEPQWPGGSFRNFFSFSNDIWPQWSQAQIEIGTNAFCRTSFLLASSRRVRSTFSSHCPLSSKPCSWLTSTISTIFSLWNF